MATGGVQPFRTFIEYLLENDAANPFDFGATPNTIKCALVDSTITLTKDTADPCWGTGGTTDLSANEVTGTNYPAGGRACANPAVTIASNTAQLEIDNPATWTMNAGNPTNCRWAVIYDDTATNKNCIAFLDLGSVLDGTKTDLTIAWGSPSFITFGI